MITFHQGHLNPLTVNSILHKLQTYGDLNLNCIFTYVKSNVNYCSTKILITCLSLLCNLHVYIKLENKCISPSLGLSVFMKVVNTCWGEAMNIIQYSARCKM